MQTTDENSVFLYDFYLATFILPISIIRVVWLWCPVLGLVLFRDNIPLQPGDKSHEELLVPLGSPKQFFGQAWNLVATKKQMY